MPPCDLTGIAYTKGRVMSEAAELHARGSMLDKYSLPDRSLDVSLGVGVLKLGLKLIVF